MKLAGKEYADGSKISAADAELIARAFGFDSAEDMIVRGAVADRKRSEWDIWTGIKAVADYEAGVFDDVT